MPNMFLKAVLVTGIAAVAAASSPALADGDAGAGKKVYRKCAVCHDTKPGKNKIGPSLHGVFGRKAAQAPGFRFSSALKKAGIVWNEENLDKYLKSPAKMIRGTRMVFPGIRSETERADVIAYLKTLK